MEVGVQHRNLLLFAAIMISFYACMDQAHGLPLASDEANEWPAFQKRNIAALARDGYLQSAQTGFKRSISTLAKNGQLPTFRSPYDETDKHEDESDGTEKRNMASIARLRSFVTSKRNIQALARDGYRGGRNGQSYSQNDKRNIQSLARSGLIHKRDEYGSGAEYYLPFYQNSIPPLSEIDGPIDYNELYDLQQSINPDLLPPLSQIYKRDYFLNDRPDFYNQGYDNTDYSNKRGAFGSPAHGVFRSTFVEPNSRVKRYILSLPDVIEHNDLPEPDNEDKLDNQDKRSVGSIPMTRISELGNISLVPKLNQQSIQTTPTYRRRHYLLTRTRPVGSSAER